MSGQVIESGMARIRDARGRDPSTGPSGYERLFGNAQIGQLLSKVQATVISTGNELERVLEDNVTRPDGISIGKINAQKRKFKNVKTDADGNKHTIGVDVAIYRDGKVKLIELKDGDVFDTKKVAGEVQSLSIAKRSLISTGKYKEDQVSIHFCSFNQENKQQIYNGAKHLIPTGSAMTGRELCGELGIDYDRIIKDRRSQQPDNLDYFITELLKIQAVREIVKKNVAPI